MRADPYCRNQQCPHAGHRFNDSELRMIDRQMSRRQWVRKASQFAAALPINLATFSGGMFTPITAIPGIWTPDVRPPSPPFRQPLFDDDPTKYRFTPDEGAFLEEVERTSFQYFWEATNPSTGLVKDRCQADGPDPRTTSSIAAIGFGLTALCIADHRGWADGKKIRERVRNTLRFAATRLNQVHGFFFHFLNTNTGDRDFQSEVSTIDTSILLCGVATRISKMQKFAIWRRSSMSVLIGPGFCKAPRRYRWAGRPSTVSFRRGGTRTAN
jgi:hypothetical protein